MSAARKSWWQLSATSLSPAAKIRDRLGISTIGELLRYWPRKYLTLGELTDLRQLNKGDVVTVAAEVVSASVKFPAKMVYQRGPGTKKRKSPTYRTVVTLTDGHAQIDAVFFYNNAKMAHWRHDALPPGRRAYFSGKVSSFAGRLQLTSPAITGEDSDDVEALTRPIPVYRASGKLTSSKIAKLIDTVLQTYPIDDLPDPIPADVASARGFTSLGQALRDMHTPRADEWRDARRRFTFEEAFVLQVALLRRRQEVEKLTARAVEPVADGVRAEFMASLPFDLTTGQQDAVTGILGDIAKTIPMHRLLAGEVGSGKTIVALIAMLAVIDSGAQAALLAPTEVLAEQHHRSITTMLGTLAAAGMLGAADNAIKVTLLTGSMKTAPTRTALADIATGHANIVIGTHSLLSDRVEFADLRLAVIDEQHRFGVDQRDALRAKSKTHAHVLFMTATPIPRTVAMTVFGDLETTQLRELPRGRQPIATHIVHQHNARWFDRVWQRVAEEVAQGRQIFVVCPRIGETTDAGKPVPAAPDEPQGVYEIADRLAALDVLSHVRQDILHGRQNPPERAEVMSRFVSGDLDMVIATTIIEVGVDVPNATTMVIFDADRFGLSQLHQLRGRVGRGEHPGLCLVMTQAELGTSNPRLEALAQHSDGFTLADIDLQLRREGDVLGAQQSGFSSSLKLLRVLDDKDIIDDAREAAQHVLHHDADLAHHSELQAAIELMLQPEHEAYLDRS